MFVVRIIADADRSDFKVFDHLDGAQQRFDQGWLQTHEGEFDSIAIFEVSGATSPSDAVHAVKQGDKDRARLVNLHESSDIRLARLAPKIRIEL